MVFSDGNSESSNEVAVFKILMVGDSGTGKSSLLLRYVDNVIPDDLTSTIGVDFKSKSVVIDGTEYKITVWDTAGQERFRTLVSTYYRGAQGVICVYDVTNRDSFEHLNDWFIELETYNVNQVAKIIVGNKTDKENDRQVSRLEGEQLARKMGTLFIETSAKVNTGVEDAFLELIRKIIENPLLWKITSPSAPVLRENDSNCSC